MPQYETIAVTPELAKKWLESNAANNRLPKTSKIPQYARDMKSGSWRSGTGETIKFDHGGTLIDGQNRLRAVIRSGCTITFDIAWSVDRDAMQVIDTGAMRGAADVLRVAGAADRMRSSAIVRWIVLWEAGEFMNRGGQFNPTTSEIIARYQADPLAFDAAAQRSGDCAARGLGQASAAGTAHYLFAKIDGEQCHRFFDQYISGAELPGASPVLTLRNRMARVRADRLTRSEQLALFIRSWNAFRRGKTLERIMIVKGELVNATFPQPV